MPEAPAVVNEFLSRRIIGESAFQVSETRSHFRKFPPCYVLRL